MTKSQPISICVPCWGDCVLRDELGLRQFHVRGLRKVQMEMLWACLTYNLQHWIRLHKLQPASAAT